MHVDIAIAQFRPVKGSPAESLARIGRVLSDAAGSGNPPDVVVFPEASLTGYFLEGGIRELAWTASDLAGAIVGLYHDAGIARPLDVAIGFYEIHDHRLYNSAAYLALDEGGVRIVHVHRKVFLPTYGVFQEERFIESGQSVRAFDTRWGRTALLICEDAFHSITSTLAALDGAQVLLVPSASPARGAAPGPGMPGNLERWERIARAAAEEHGVFVAVAQLVGFEGGKGFAGGSAAYGPRGRRLAGGPLWDEALIPLACELDEVTAARAEQPLLADLERTLPRLLGSGGAPTGGRVAAGEPSGLSSGRGDPGEEAGGGQPVRGASGAAGAAPAASGADPKLAASGRHTAPDPALDPADDSALDLDLELVTEWLIRFLREELRARRGFERAVVGLSGGVDSSLTAALCARALGPDAVSGFLLPYRTSSPESLEHGRLVAESLGIEAHQVDISDAVDGYLATQPDADDTRRGNVMARLRAVTLFDQGARLGALPVGTGNKSERLLGYFTWHADDSPPINPLGDLFKTQVWRIARHIGIPAEIVDKPASADLIRGQTDEADLGVSYPQADLILHHLLRGRTPERLVAAGFDAGHVKIVHGRLQGTHWKRHLPTVAMLSATTIGEWYLRPVDY